jgi:hypothetical protein
LKVGRIEQSEDAPFREGKTSRGSALRFTRPQNTIENLPEAVSFKAN